MESADNHRPQACPKGLLHGYGIHVVRSNIQLNGLQERMGHSSIETTAIYANEAGPEEVEIAEGMWTWAINAEELAGCSIPRLVLSIRRLGRLTQSSIFSRQRPHFLAGTARLSL